MAKSKGRARRSKPSKSIYLKVPHKSWGEPTGEESSHRTLRLSIWRSSKFFPVRGTAADSHSGFPLACALLQGTWSHCGHPDYGFWFPDLISSSFLVLWSLQHWTDGPELSYALHDLATSTGPHTTQPNPQFSLYDILHPSSSVTPPSCLGHWGSSWEKSSLPLHWPLTPDSQTLVLS